MNSELRKLRAEFVERSKHRKRLVQLVALSDEELRRIAGEMKKFYNPAPPPYDLPSHIMHESDAAKLLKMKISEEPCEFCGSDKVRVGKKFDLCTECQHCKLKS